MQEIQGFGDKFTEVKSFIGTAKHFEEIGVLLNGMPLNQVAVNMLAGAGLIEYIGEGNKPARGKTPKMYRAKTRGELQFAVPEKYSDLRSVNA